MSMSFYISPEQAMKDRADFARLGIEKGRCAAALSCVDGIVLLADNPSGTLHKISEIYDRIGFGAAGRYNEFEKLRIAGIRQADFRGYSYHRRDVTGRSLANGYAQILGEIFASAAEKPFEVELFLAELGEVKFDTRKAKDVKPIAQKGGKKYSNLLSGNVETNTSQDRIFRISYDGSITDTRDFCVVGGKSSEISAEIAKSYSFDLAFPAAIELLRQAFIAVSKDNEKNWEIAVLDRSLPGRTFRRITT